MVTVEQHCRIDEFIPVSKEQVLPASIKKTKNSIALFEFRILTAILHYFTGHFQSQDVWSPWVQAKNSL